MVKCDIYACKKEAARFAARSGASPKVRRFCEKHWNELKDKPWFTEISEADVPIAEVMLV